MIRWFRSAAPRHGGRGRWLHAWRVDDLGTPYEAVSLCFFATKPNGDPTAGDEKCRKCLANGGRKAKEWKLMPNEPQLPLEVPSGGITLTDLVASHALQGLIAMMANPVAAESATDHAHERGKTIHAHLAEAAYDYAAAMVAEKKRRG